MVKVCARYCGTTILLGEMEEEQAEEFMKHPYILYNADETEDGEEDCIYPDEMFIDYLYKQVFTDIMERKNRKKNDFQIFM